jgi:hypothetical protein
LTSAIGWIGAHQRRPALVASPAGRADVARRLAGPRRCAEETFLASRQRGGAIRTEIADHRCLARRRTRVVSYANGSSPTKRTSPFGAARLAGRDRALANAALRWPGIGWVAQTDAALAFVSAAAGRAGGQRTDCRNGGALDRHRIAAPLHLERRRAGVEPLGGAGEARSPVFAQTPGVESRPNAYELARIDRWHLTRAGVPGDEVVIARACEPATTCFGRNTSTLEDGLPIAVCPHASVDRHRAGARATRATNEREG